MKITEFLTQLCEHCGIDLAGVTITIDESDEVFNTVQIDLSSEESGLLIGYHGETLESIQRLLRLVFQRSPEDKKILLNINQYREQREEKLKEIATTAAQEVLETGVEYIFNSSLASHERFVIHSFISENDAFSELESVSLGDGRERRLHIRIKQKAE
jgi:spoIIIJ-associated protein